MSSDDFGGFLMFMFFVAVIWFLGAWVGMLLWNGCLIPAIPGIKAVTTLQMGGLILLTGILTVGPGYLFGGKK